jgi:myxalamid-type polyketide synthase MxaE and MxaD
MGVFMKPPPPSFESLVDLLQWRAEREPERRVFTLLDEDGEGERGHLTFGELDAAARAIAAQLQGLGLEGQRVVLLFPASLHFVCALFGCLYAGVVAIPAPPPSPSRIARTLPRLQGIVEDARPVAVLTDREGLALSGALIEASPALGELRWLAVEDAPGALAAGWRRPTIEGRSLAYLQYTSGSTTAPKGTLLSHANLLANLAVIREGKSYDADSVAVIWVPNYHDDGLIHGILEPIYTGYRCVLMHSATFVARPFQWLSAITRYRATHAGGPNFAYELCVRKVTDAQIALLDLGSWRLAYNAAEPIRLETLRAFHERFERCGFRWTTFAPCYGLAEATLTVSVQGGQEGPRFCVVDAAALEQRGEVVEVAEDQRLARTIVGCGRPVVGADVAIVPPGAGTRCPPGFVGEIWLKSACVAGGYWDRPEATEETFGAHLPDTGEGPFLRTGDLGFLKDGELFLTGRLKDLIIIRGENRYPQDIEWTVQRCHPAVRPGCVAAFSITAGGAERLALVAEVSPPRPGKGAAAGAGEGDLNEVLGAIRQAVAEGHDLEVHAIALLAPGAIPKTSSGKIQRRACKDGLASGALEALVQWASPIGEPAGAPAAAPAAAAREEAAAPTRGGAAVQSWLVDYMARRLGVSPDSIDVRAPFARLGLDSAAGVALAAELGDWLGRALPQTTAWDHPSIRALSAHLAGQAPASRRGA